MSIPDSYYAKWKRFRLSRSDITYIANTTGLNFNTLYKALNGTIPIKSKVAAGIVRFTKGAILPNEVTDGDIDMLNKFLFCEFLSVDVEKLL